MFERKGDQVNRPWIRSQRATTRTRRYEVLNAALQSLQQRFTSLQHHDDELGKALRAAQFKFESMSRDFKEKCLQIEGLEANVQELTNQNTGLNSNETRASDLARKVEELKHTRERIGDLETQLKSTQSRLLNLASKQQFDEEKRQENEFRNVARIPENENHERKKKEEEQKQEEEIAHQTSKM